MVNLEAILAELREENRTLKEQLGKMFEQPCAMNAGNAPPGTFHPAKVQPTPNGVFQKV